MFDLSKKNIRWEDIRDNVPCNVILADGTKFQIYWQKFGQVMMSQRFSDTINNERRLSCKKAAISIIKGFAGYVFVFPILWRWFYYIKHYRTYELQSIIELANKMSCLSNVDISGKFIEFEGKGAEKKYLHVSRRFLGIFKVEDFDYRWRFTIAQLIAIMYDENKFPYNDEVRRGLCEEKLLDKLGLR